MVERAGKQCGVDPGKPKRQVDEPHIAGPTSHIVAIPIWFQDLTVTVPVRVHRFAHPCPRERPRHVERTTLLNAEERAVSVLLQGLRSREIEAACEVRIYAGDRLAVQAYYPLAAVTEADEGDVKP